MELTKIKQIFFEVISTIPGIVNINNINGGDKSAPLLDRINVKKENEYLSFYVDIDILLGVNVSSLVQEVSQSLHFKFKSSKYKIKEISFFVSGVIYE